MNRNRMFNFINLMRTVRQLFLAAIWREQNRDIQCMLTLVQCPVIFVVMISGCSAITISQLMLIILLLNL